MAKLYFNYSAMNAGKSTTLLQAAHNYNERGMSVYLLTADLDTRAGKNTIGSRIGISAPSHTFKNSDNLFDRIENALDDTPLACVLVDEAQWLTKEQVWELSSVVDTLKIPVVTYGLRTDFQGNLFEGSGTLLAIADTIKEIKAVCHCGKKASLTLRLDSTGKAIFDGPQTQVGGNDTYESVCRRHWKEALHVN